MNTLIDLFLLTIIICFIIDVSGISNDIRKLVSRLILKYTKIKISWEELKIKPFLCSLCMTFWCGLGYLLFTHNFTIPYIAFVAFLSLISSNISGFLFCIKDILAVIEGLIQKLIQKFTL